MISTQNLKYTYSGGALLEFPDFSCDAKDVMLILGTSGVGKTTLLHLLGGILTAQQGSIRINDTEINKLSGSALDKFRGQNIGIVFQQNHFVHSINVLENVLLAQSMAGNPTDKKQCMTLLERLNIGHKAKKSIRNLSEGEKQRVAIARALVNSPRLILADEPTSALDDANCNEVLSLLEEQAKAVGSALIVVTHDTRLKDKIAHRIILQ
jgi:ABC-type lipoprotein export system ATPase subunit